MPASAKKKGASKRRRKEPATDPSLALLTRFPSGEPFTPKADQYPDSADCILFMPAVEQELPAPTILQLRTIVATFTAHLLDVLIGPIGPIFLVIHDPDKLPRLAAFLAKDLTVPGLDCRLEASRLTYKELLDDLRAFSPAADNISSDDDFLMPSSSESEPEPAPAQRKPKAAKAKPEVPVPRNVLQDIRAPVASLPPLPVVPAAAFDTSTGPDLSQPEPSQPAAGDASSSTVADLPAPKDSRTSASTQPAQRPRRKLRFRAVDFRSLTVTIPEQPAAKTVLIRPTSQDDCLRKLHPKAIITELSSHGDYTGLRDIRQGGIAVDFPPATDLAPLLAMTSLVGVPVSCQLPKDACSCSAVLSGVHPLITEEEVLQDLATSPPCRILAVKRLAKPGQQSWSVKVTFEGTSLPERGFLYGRSRRLLPYSEKPLFCSKCARFGHPARTCRSTRRCTTCSLDHEEEICPNAEKPLCPNCGGAHDAKDSICQARRFQQKVCEVRASSRVPHKVARAAVTKAAKSYAEAAKGSSIPPKKTPETKGPSFIPNVAHPRPPSTTGETNHSQLAAIFRGLLAILTTAITTGDLAGAIPKMAALFAEQAPGADPGLFTV